MLKSGLPQIGPLRSQVRIMRLSEDKRQFTVDPVPAQSSKSWATRPRTRRTSPQ